MPLRHEQDAWDFLHYLEKSNPSDILGICAEMLVVLDGAERRHLIGCYEQVIKGALHSYEIPFATKGPNESKGIFFDEQDRKILLKVLQEYLRNN